MSEKTEKPTAKKLRDAAKKGQTFKGKDITTVIVLAVGILVLGSFFNLRQLIQLMQGVALAGGYTDPMKYVRTLAKLFLSIVMPFVLLCALAGALPSLIQSRFTLAFEAIRFDPSVLNPVNGFKKLFSMRTVKELVKTLLYLGVFILALYLFIKLYHRQVFQLFRGGAEVQAHMWVWLSMRLIFLFIGCALPVLVLDALSEFFLYYKDMKMEKHEVKQEYKQSEGNPEVKSKRRDVHIELLSEQVKSDIEKSNFILANPTHIAIGIYVNADVVAWPFISVKETNARAQAAIRYAEQVGVPVVRNIPLARSIYRNSRCYSFVAEEALDEVMRILGWLREVELAARQPDMAPEPEVPAGENG